MLDYAIFKLGLHQEFVGGEIGFIGQFATAKFLNCRRRTRVKQVILQVLRLTPPGALTVTLPETSKRPPQALRSDLGPEVARPGRVAEARQTY